ncbi:hypothetical protein G6F59_014341 [Rhizopus arrhizus]|nr:hypothetical protein G6F59_014341 [Rhizopus arrhizus]
MTTSAQPARHGAVVVHALHVVGIAGALRRDLGHVVGAYEEAFVLGRAVDGQFVDVGQVLGAVVVRIVDIDQDRRQRRAQVHDDVVGAAATVHIHAIRHARRALLAGQRRQLVQHDQVVAVVAVQSDTACQRTRRQVDIVVALARQHRGAPGQQDLRHPDLVVAGTGIHGQTAQEIGVRQGDQVGAGTGGDVGGAADDHRIQQHDVVA